MRQHLSNFPHTCTRTAAYHIAHLLSQHCTLFCIALASWRKTSCFAYSRHKLMCNSHRLKIQSWLHEKLRDNERLRAAEGSTRRHASTPHFEPFAAVQRRGLKSASFMKEKQRRKNSRKFPRTEPIFDSHDTDKQSDPIKDSYGEFGLKRGTFRVGLGRHGSLRERQAILGERSREHWTWNVRGPHEVNKIQPG